MKPMLASDWVSDKAKYPCCVQPKIDGVRGLNFFGTLTGRSLKKHANKSLTAKFSGSLFAGLDGELAVSDLHIYDESLCRSTTSATTTIDGSDGINWWVFDYITHETKELPYKDRYDILKKYVEDNKLDRYGVFVVPMVMASNEEQLMSFDAELVGMGYEGTIVRDPNEPYKYGRSTVREGGLLRIKQFVDGEAKVLEVVEGFHNANEAETNELGQTERSTHQENMIPNGMAGSLTCRAIKDICDPQGALVIFCGQVFTVAPGKMTHADRKLYFANPDLIIGKIIKFKFFPKGIKDKPRFPTFQGFRSEVDM